MGVFTRVHRRSGAVALAVGVTYGGLRLLAPWVAESWGVAILPRIMVANYASYILSMLLTAATQLPHSQELTPSSHSAWKTVRRRSPFTTVPTVAAAAA